MFSLIDTHGHLQDPAFDEDREAVWHRAEEAGVGVVIPGYHLDSSRQAVALARQWEGAWALVGMHPHEVEAAPAGWLEALEALIDDPAVIGVGEIGLDYYREISPRALQQSAFMAQLELARRRALPVAVHSRDAEEDTLALMAEGGVLGVLHSFSGGQDMARQALDLGWYLSFSGMLTFKNAGPLREVCTWTPLDRILVETDAPYLAPVPKRGRRNEPQYVVHTAAMVASLKNLPLEEVNAQLVANTRQAFSRL
jgi:TatD DNase family protein